MAQSDQKGIYQCNNCHDIKQSKEIPSIRGCKRWGIHDWEMISLTGSKILLCINCTQIINSSRSPKMVACPMSDYHYWIPLAVSGINHTKCSDCNQKIWTDPVSMDSPTMYNYLWKSINLN